MDIALLFASIHLCSQLTADQIPRFGFITCNEEDLLDPRVPVSPGRTGVWVPALPRCAGSSFRGEGEDAGEGEDEGEGMFEGFRRGGQFW